MTRKRNIRSTFLGLTALIIVGTAMPSWAAIPATERQVLLNIYTSTTGASWITNTGWNGAVGTECSWYKITCDDTESHVTSISLSSNNLTGSLPALSGLTSLQHFNVAYNQLSGPIPALTGLTTLQSFLVNNNHLAGPLPALTGLTSLQHFHADSNLQLIGAIPALTGLTNLIGISVGDNQLTGSIPALTGLTNLGEFRAPRNRLSGPIPALTPSLVRFDVGQNRLTGAVPAAPAGLQSDGSTLCPNPLNTTPSANDAGWNTATGITPWWATPYANNKCDDIFTSGFEG